MASTRQPAVAGTFYPAQPRELRGLVTEYLDAADVTGAVPKAVIVPHAGYPYSGPVAASAYALLKPACGLVRRVVLLGPAHRVAFSGLALPSHDAFATPLGTVPIDTSARAALEGLPQVRVFDAPHAREHSLEVHLPFLQEVLGEFHVVPLVVGDATAAEVGEVLERLWDGPDTLVVVSSDLSHYHDYRTARRLDAATTHAIEAMRHEDLDPSRACGSVPVSGLLWVARKRGLSVRTLDLRNSGDTAGPRDQVVGYGAYAVN
jgi:AmmeMemoRadiSam system protein B